jgi:FSR family fosmidomycin resistance protein-like MFS transporter
MDDRNTDTNERTQWGKLAVLTGLHLVSDMFPGYIPAILTPIREAFGLSLTMGIVLLSVLNASTNGMQVATGHLRSRSERPVFMQIAFALTGILCLLYFVPTGSLALPVLFAIMIVGGTGVALFHPESMRAIHGLGRISSPVKTPIIMMGGYFGFCGGAWLGACLVERWGFKGLLLFLPAAAAACAAVPFMRFRLAVEGEAPAGGSAGGVSLPFWFLFVMAVPVCTGTTVVVSLLPTHVNLLGLGLSFGGLSSFLFGAGIGAGGVLWGVIARRRGELLISVVSLFLGIPFLVLYLAYAGFRPAVWVLLICGFCFGGGYPMIVSLARNAAGMNLGGRMGWMLGGVWGIASVMLMLLSPLAEYAERHHGNLTVVMYVACALFAVSGFLGLSMLRRNGVRS